MTLSVAIFGVRLNIEVLIYLRCVSGIYSICYCVGLLVRFIYKIRQGEGDIGAV